MEKVIHCICQELVPKKKYDNWKTALFLILYGFYSFQLIQSEVANYGTVIQTFEESCMSHKAETFEGGVFKQSTRRM